MITGLSRSSLGRAGGTNVLDGGLRISLVLGRRRGDVDEPFEGMILPFRRFALVVVCLEGPRDFVDNIEAAELACLDDLLSGMRDRAW